MSLNDTIALCNTGVFVRKATAPLPFINKNYDEMPET